MLRRAAFIAGEIVGVFLLMCMATVAVLVVYGALWAAAIFWGSLQP